MCVFSRNGFQVTSKLAVNQVLIFFSSFDKKRKCQEITQLYKRKKNGRRFKRNWGAQEHNEGYECYVNPILFSFAKHKFHHHHHFILSLKNLFFISFYFFVFQVLSGEDVKQVVNGNPKLQFAKKRYVNLWKNPPTDL